MFWDGVEREEVCVNCGSRPRPANTLPYVSGRREPRHQRPSAKRRASDLLAEYQARGR